MTGAAAEESAWASSIRATTLKICLEESGRKWGMCVLAYLFDAGRHCFKSGNGGDLNFAVGVYDAGKGGASVMPFGDQEVASIFEGGFR